MKANFDDLQAVIDEQAQVEYEDISAEERDIDNMMIENADELEAIHEEATATKSAIIPSDIFIKDWLKKFLENLQIPQVITKAFLINLGSDLLTEKIADVEMYNMAGLGNKKRIPEKLDFDEVAVVTMTLYEFKLIQLTDKLKDRVLSVYSSNPDDRNYGTYAHDTEFMYEILERIAPNYKKRDMDDVIDKIKRSAELVKPTRNRNIFAVNNGIFNKETRELLPFSTDYIFTKKIPVNYNEDAQNVQITSADGFVWNVEDWIKDLMSDDEDSTTLIWQVIADCLQPNYSLGKSIWFYSERGNNGKGTIGQLIKNLLGEGNYSSLSVADFSHEYLKETLMDATANIADENDVDIYIDSVKDYKATITGDDISINIKYGQPLRMKYFGANIQMMNGLPKTKDSSNSLYRRLIIVPFLKSFTNNGERKYIKEDYIAQDDVLEYVLYKALNMDFDEYIVPLHSAELLAEYKETNNTVLEFWNEYKDQFVWDLLPTSFLYAGYQYYLGEINPSGKPVNQRTFMSRLSVIAEEDGDWTYKKGSEKTRSKNKMDDDEPLISEFGLDIVKVSGKPTPWMNPNAYGGNAQKRREFARSEKYAGLLRI